ncbi:hypothetical protein GCM10027605_52760 [Micromonospora zhanjiangensis]
MHGMNDVHLMLDIHRERSSELRAEAAADRLARAVPRHGPGRTWRSRWHVGGSRTPDLS